MTRESTSKLERRRMRILRAGLPLAALLAAPAVRATRSGSFSAAWTPKATGAYELRALARTSRTRVSGIRAVSVLKAQTATWYGPGFYGKSTACGVTLTEQTLGVANRSL